MSFPQQNHVGLQIRVENGAFTVHENTYEVEAPRSRDRSMGVGSTLKLYFLGMKRLSPPCHGHAHVCLQPFSTSTSTLYCQTSIYWLHVFKACASYEHRHFLNRLLHLFMEFLMKT